MAFGTRDNLMYHRNERARSEIVCETNRWAYRTNLAVSSGLLDWLWAMARALCFLCSRGGIVPRDSRQLSSNRVLRLYLGPNRERLPHWIRVVFCSLQRIVREPGRHWGLLRPWASRSRRRDARSESRANLERPAAASARRIWTPARRRSVVSANLCRTALLDRCRRYRDGGSWRRGDGRTGLRRLAKCSPGR